ncbi:hypothetical protein ACQ4PT_019338 [Festuca glaucescens]
MVKDFHGSRYAVSLEYLEKVKSNLLLDIHLNEHVEALYDHILEKAIMQENEMTALFAESKLQERIDTLLRASSSKHVKDDTPEAEGVEEAIRFGLALAVEEELLWRLLGDESVYANSLCGDEKRINLVHTAIIALQANRPKESVDCMNHVAIMECDLSILERAAFFVSTLRATLCGKRSVLKFLMRGAEVASEAELTMLVRYRKKVLQEFDQSCISQIGVINKFLLPNAVGESSVFYLRLKAHVLEVLAQVDCTNMNRYRALSAYMAAAERAEQQLCPTNREALHSALDLSLFLESSMNDTKSAWMIGRKALEKAYPMLQVRTMDSDIQASNYLFKTLSGVVTKLAKHITVEEQVLRTPFLVPFNLCWRDDRTSPEPQYRNCKSGGLDNSVVSLPKDYTHPELEAYKVNMEEDEEDYLFSRANLMHFK